MMLILEQMGSDSQRSALSHSVTDTLLFCQRYPVPIRSPISLSFIVSWHGRGSHQYTILGIG